MNILYALQGAIPGAVERAHVLVDALSVYANVEVLHSGPEPAAGTNGLAIRHRLGGLAYTDAPGNLSQLISGMPALPPALLADVWRCPVQKYDLLIHDFEPVSAWAAIFKGVPSVALGHHAAFHSKAVPRPQPVNWISEQMLRMLAPASQSVGIHFKAYAENVHPPVLGTAALSHHARVTMPFYLVRLPEFPDDKVVAMLHRHWDVNWVLLSDACVEGYQQQNVRIRPYSPDNFGKALACCTGLLSEADFGTCAEALYLRKKLFVIPRTGHYLQHCDAAALTALGVPAGEFDQTLEEQLRNWLRQAWEIETFSPAPVAELVTQILDGK